GGMGEVWLAEDTRLDRKVALKFLPHFAAQDENEKARFSQEAKAAARLSHAHIAQVYEIGEEDSRLYIVMEYVSGGSLRDQLDEARGKSLPLEEVMRWVEQTAEGLAEAHRQGITHRDIKPDNLMLTEAGEVKITDFGLARLETATRLTASGTTLGTVNYMSPELITGKDVDHRADLFSLGATFYELLSGQQAFAGADATAIFYAILNESVEPVARYRKDLPEGLEGILDKLLERRPSLRYQSALEVATDLRRMLGYTTTITPLAVWRRSFKRALKRIPGFAWVAAVLLIGTTVVVTSQLTLSDHVDLSSYTYTPLAVEDAWEDLGFWLPDDLGIIYQRQLPNGYWSFMHKRGIDESPYQFFTIPYAWKAKTLFYSKRFDRVYFTWTSQLSSVGIMGGEPQNYGAAMPNHVTHATLSPDESILAYWGRNKETREWGLYLSSLYPDTTMAPRLYQPYPENIARKVHFTPRYLEFSPDGSKLGFSYFRGTDDWFPRSDSTREGEGTAMQIEKTRSFWILPIPDGGAEPYEPFDLSLISRDDPPSFDWLDNRYVVLSHRSYRPDGGLWLGDTETGELRRITVSAIPEVNPQVNPDGDQILHVREMTDYNIVEVYLDGSLPRQVLASGMREYSPSTSETGAMTYITDLGKYAEIRIRNADNVDRLLISQDNFSAEDQPMIIWPPAVQSPDGQWLIFTGSPGGSYYNATTYWCSTQGSGVERLLPENYYARFVSGWSPDSEWVAGMMGKPDELPTFSIVKPGQSESLRSLDSRQLSSPTWSPDRKWIAAIATGSHAGPLVFISVDGEPNREEWFLSGQWDKYFGFVWSEDSSTLFIYCTEPDFRGVFAFKPEDLPFQADPTRYGDIEYTHEQYRVAELSPGFTLSSPFQHGQFASPLPGRRSFLSTSLVKTSDLWILEGFKRPRKR
ncbi:protein kinase, partial [Gemmatimonadota bacterium]